MTEMDTAESWMLGAFILIIILMLSTLAYAAVAEPVLAVMFVAIIVIPYLIGKGLDLIASMYDL